MEFGYFVHQIFLKENSKYEVKGGGGGGKQEKERIVNLIGFEFPMGDFLGLFICCSPKNSDQEALKIPFLQLVSSQTLD